MADRILSLFLSSLLVALENDEMTCGSHACCLAAAPQ